MTDQEDVLDRHRYHRIVKGYGRVRWLVSVYHQDDGLWLARLSCPYHEETIEGVSSTRCLAVDSATRQILTQLQNTQETTP